MDNVPLIEPEPVPTPVRPRQSSLPKVKKRLRYSHYLSSFLIVLFFLLFTGYLYSKIFATNVDEFLKLQKCPYDSLLQVSYFEPIFKPSIFVILTSSLKTRYLFVLPFTAASWKRIKVEPVIILIGKEKDYKEDKQAKVTIKMLEKMKVKIHYFEAERISPTSLGQVIRIFGAALSFMKSLISDNSIIITSDADLAVFHLKNHIPDLNLGKTLHLYNSQCCGEVTVPSNRGNYSVPMYPMGTIGATVKTWRDIMGFESSNFTVKNIEDYLVNEFGENFFSPADEYNPDMNGSPVWYADQALVSYKIHEWLKIESHKSQVSERTELPQRIDRISWPTINKFAAMNVQDVDDCHQPITAYNDADWPAFKPFVWFLFCNNDELLQTFYQYRQDFVAP